MFLDLCNHFIPGYFDMKTWLKEEYISKQLIFYINTQLNIVYSHFQKVWMQKSLIYVLFKKCAFKVHETDIKYLCYIAHLMFKILYFCFIYLSTFPFGDVKTPAIIINCSKHNKSCYAEFTITQFLVVIIIKTVSSINWAMVPVNMYMCSHRPKPNVTSDALSELKPLPL